MVFWKKSFAAKASEDNFQKNYAYNIRHNYGKEGKRANYASYSCSKIITGNQPSTGDHHGCPFKHFDAATSLTSLLSSYAGPTGLKLSEAQVSELLDLVRNKHYQVACTLLFEYTRGVPKSSVETVSWPNKFYETSLRTNININNLKK